MSKWSFSENFYWKNNFPQCGGPNQSPINLDSEIIQKCETLCHFDTFYESSKCYVTYINNLIQLNYDKGSYLKFQDILYELKNITVHSPSLHSIDGEKYDLEICLIHSLNSDESDTNGIILSRMFQKGPHYGNPEIFINQFINDLPRVEVSNEMEINVSNNWNVNMLLPKNKSYFMYDGSLPFPPCTEQYKVFVYEDIGSIGETNINIFQNNISDSFRPIQLLNNRSIFYIADKGKFKKKSIYKKSSNKYLKCSKKFAPDIVHDTKTSPTYTLPVDVGFSDSTKQYIKNVLLTLVILMLFVYALQFVKFAFYHKYIQNMLKTLGGPVIFNEVILSKWDKCDRAGTQKKGQQKAPKGGQVPGAPAPRGQVPGAPAPRGQVPGASAPRGQVPGAPAPRGQVPGAQVP